MIANYLENCNKISDLHIINELLALDAIDADACNRAIYSIAINNEEDDLLELVEADTLNEWVNLDQDLEANLEDALETLNRLIGTAKLKEIAENFREYETNGLNLKQEQEILNQVIARLKDKTNN